METTSSYEPADFSVPRPWEYEVVEGKQDSSYIRIFSAVTGEEACRIHYRAAKQRTATATGTRILAAVRETSDFDWQQLDGGLLTNVLVAFQHLANFAKPEDLRPFQAELEAVRDILRRKKERQQ